MGGITGDTNKADFSGRLELLHSRDGLVDDLLTRRKFNIVYLKKINDIGLQTLQALFNRVGNTGGGKIEAGFQALYRTARPW
jgi:hypothetical protein